MNDTGMTDQEMYGWEFPLIPAPEEVTFSILRT